MSEDGTTGAPAGLSGPAGASGIRDEGRHVTRD
jgi:hypothetical protein